MDGLALAQALCARLCHDLGGPVGSLLTVAELGAAGGAEAEELARSALDQLHRRIHLYRLLAGSAEDLSRTGLEACLHGMLGHGKVRLDATRLAEGGAVPAAFVPALLAAILLAAEGVPRGGAVILSGDPRRELLLTLDGKGAAWPPALGALLAVGEAPEPAPRTVLAHFLCVAADEAGLAPRLALGVEGAALLLLPRGG